MKILYLFYTTYYQSSLFSQEVEFSKSNFNSLRLFYNNLHSIFKKNLTIRLRSNTMGSMKMNEDKFILSLGKEINIDFGDEHFNTIKDKYDLIIVGYDSTAIFELLAYKNIPFMVFFSKNYFYNYIPKTKKDFLLLKKKKILFFNETDMANEINKNYKSIKKKWNDKINSTSIKKFCKKYCSGSIFKFYKLKNLINKNII